FNNRSCEAEQSPEVALIDCTTGALVPIGRKPLTKRVNGPKMLLSPAVNVVVKFPAPFPPLAVKGKAVPGAPGMVASVPLTRFRLTTVTLVKSTVLSGIPSPLVSTVNVPAVVTVLPGRCVAAPEQTVVT